MKIAIIFLLCVITTSCTSKTENQKNEVVSIAATYAKPKHQSSFISAFAFDNVNDGYKPYDINFKLQPLENDICDFIIDMRLYNGAHFVSPNAKRDFSGKFKIILEENNKLEFLDKLSESPLSVEENDPHPYVDGKVNWIRQNTTYAQKIKFKTDKDFFVKGSIQFTIEPRCTLEQIPFTIFRDSGELKIMFLNKC